MVDNFRGRSAAARDASAAHIAADRPKILADYVCASDALSERHRIARELHDRVGNGLSVAQRQLELLQFHGDKAPVSAAARAEKARRAVVESMESLRAVICDLRREAPLGGRPDSLEDALAGYLDAVRADDVTPRLRVTGDETLVPPVVREESFLIVREAIRNALNHGAPGRVRISVDIAPRELRAVVADTGRGFDRATAPPAATLGLSSMRERAALLGGSVSVLSRPGRGTRVELVVPLPASRPGPSRDTRPRRPRPHGARTRIRTGSRPMSAMRRSSDDITIVIVDDHAILREGVREILEAQGDMVVAGEAGDSAGAIAMIAKKRPGVVLLDVEIPGADAVTTVHRIRALSPSSKVIILSMYDAPHLLRDLLAAGVRGYLLKSVRGQELVAAIRGAHRDAGRVVLDVSRESLARARDPAGGPLSAREREVLELTARALSNAQIAARLGLTEATVKRHLRNIFGKLGAVSRIDAVNKAAAASLIAVAGPRPRSGT